MTSRLNWFARSLKLDLIGLAWLRCKMRIAKIKEKSTILESLDCSLFVLRDHFPGSICNQPSSHALIFVILFTLTYFEARKCYTQKCVNLRQNSINYTLNVKLHIVCKIIHCVDSILESIVSLAIFSERLSILLLHVHRHRAIFKWLWSGHSVQSFETWYFSSSFIMEVEGRGSPKWDWPRSCTLSATSYSNIGRNQLETVQPFQYSLISNSQQQY